MPTVIDEVTKRKVDIRKTKLVLINDNGILGYTKEIDQCIVVFSKNKKFEEYFYRERTYTGLMGCRVLVLYEKFKDKIFFSNKNGTYMFKDEWYPDEILVETLTKYAIGGEAGAKFPYHFVRSYEAVNHFDIFKDKQEVIKETSSWLNENMDYTFGLEFETSAGMIPERICFRDGLIPLRDGSITGFEYSTVVMNPKEKGISLLKQQLDTLREYTIFNKECSLHIHFGNYPMDPDKIYALYRMCYCLQNEISNLVPYLTFRSSEYKNSGKDYCKLLPGFSNFKELYRGLVGKNFMGSLEQPHPCDPNRDRKWNVHTRYFCVNFLNLLCYKVNKTVEFRFLRPTYNFKKIKTWIYIFNAIMKFSEKHYEDINNGRYNGISLEDIVKNIYPNSISDKVKTGIKLLKILRETQYRNGDEIGQDLIIEEQLFV